MEAPQHRQSQRTRLNSFMENADIIQDLEEIELPEGGHVYLPVVKGEFSAIPDKVQQFIARYVSTLSILQPEVCLYSNMLPKGVCTLIALCIFYAYGCTYSCMYRPTCLGIDIVHYLGVYQL